jgi:hypothetical protein
MIEFKKYGSGGIKVTRGGDDGKGNHIHIAVKIRKKWKCIHVDLGTATTNLAGVLPYKDASNWVQSVRTERIWSKQKHLV